METAAATEPTDWADRHVARWHDHWIDLAFDAEVEAIVVRMARLMRHLKDTTREALDQVGLQDFEYQTLHQLMVRETPGHATPSQLADDLGLSGAGMTGRLDGLERAGWIRRSPAAEDRRRVDIEVTKAGMEIWKQAMKLRCKAEEELIAVLEPTERQELAVLLKKLTLGVEP
ncbi:MarR family winged helix-turn-helix transcriptional regulator [Nocardioides sp. DS6]|uniref:MarR family winged helix-turn-helix transcriptional regulator n=1 Tax=Nocardioides eburneus TaxID=3231482 RepID=A0ABV3SUT4_9ACTN